MECCDFAGASSLINSKHICKNSTIRIKMICLFLMAAIKRNEIIVSHNHPTVAGHGYNSH